MLTGRKKHVCMYARAEFEAFKRKFIAKREMLYKVSNVHEWKSILTTMFLVFGASIEDAVPFFVCGLV